MHLTKWPANVVAPKCNTAWMFLHSESAGTIWNGIIHHFLITVIPDADVNADANADAEEEDEDLCSHLCFLFKGCRSECTDSLLW